MPRNRDSISDRLERIEQAVEQRTDSVLTAREAAAYLDISIHHLWRLTSQGRIPHYKPGGKKLYFRRSELDDWIFSRKVRSKDEIIAQSESSFGRFSSIRKVREPIAAYCPTPQRLGSSCYSPARDMYTLSSGHRSIHHRLPRAQHFCPRSIRRLKRRQICRLKGAWFLYRATNRQIYRRGSKGGRHD